VPAFATHERARERRAIAEWPEKALGEIGMRAGRTPPPAG
jgi:hypothetical protein